jgi:aminoglycoside N3'-acetyltransferase
MGFEPEPAAEASPETLAEQLRAHGVEGGGVLLVHMSYRAVRPVKGGPGGVVEALREAVGPAGTIVMPSWSGDDTVPFDAGRSPACPSLGATADLFWRAADVRRSAHPFAFAAAGPEADRIVADPLPLPPHGLASPVGRVYELDGQVLLLGVGHDANTTIHLAEVLAGVPYAVPKTCTVLEDGRPVCVEYLENDHCCERFALADDWLRQAGAQWEGRVGNAVARLVRSRDVVRVVTERLQQDPLVFLHSPGDQCADCNEARATVAAERVRPGSDPAPTGVRPPI